MMATIALLFATATTPVVADTFCVKLSTPWSGDTLPDESRQRSPLDSVTFKVGGKPVKVCYGRPSLRGREKVVGGDGEPYGLVWRTGANEPTIIFTTAPVTIAGVKVPAGEHSLYTIADEKEWQIIINDGTSQWGYEYDQSQDLGRGKAQSEVLQQSIEQFTIRADSSTNAKEILLEWQKFRVHIPVAPD